MDNPRGNPAPKMKWSVEDDKLYEDALKEFPEEVENRWEKIASRVPGKSPEDVKAHYNTLFVDSLISVFDFPDNEAKADSINNPIDHDDSTETSIHSCEISSRPSSRVVNDDGPRWTEEEHRYYIHTSKQECKSMCIHQYFFCIGFLLSLNHFLMLIFIVTQNNCFLYFLLFLDVNFLYYFWYVFP